MRNTPYMPNSNAGIGAMLNAFATNIAANNGALATKFDVSDADITRVTQANLV